MNILAQTESQSVVMGLIIVLLVAFVLFYKATGRHRLSAKECVLHLRRTLLNYQAEKAEYLAGAERYPEDGTMQFKTLSQRDIVIASLLEYFKTAGFSLVVRHRDLDPEEMVVRRGTAKYRVRFWQLQSEADRHVFAVWLNRL